MYGISVYPQHVPNTHECWKLSAIDLLRQCDNLLGNMASNLKPSPIKRMYVCVHICVCVCVFVCICVCMCVYVCICVCTYMCDCMYMCMESKHHTDKDFLGGKEAMLPLEIIFSLRLALMINLHLADSGTQQSKFCSL